MQNSQTQNVTVLGLKNNNLFYSMIKSFYYSKNIFIIIIIKSCYKKVIKKTLATVAAKNENKIDKLNTNKRIEIYNSKFLLLYPIFY